MKTFSLLTAAFCAFPLASAVSMAQDTGFYLRGDAGIQWTGDTQLKEFFGEPLSAGNRIRFDPGPRIGITAGYSVTDWFAAEAETGVMASEIDSISGRTRGEATFSSVPLLANVRFQCPAECRIRPYIGGGVGMSSAIIAADDLEIGGTTMDGSEGDAVFAYQAFGGIRYQLNDRMGVSLEYHYFAANGASWKAESTVGTGSDRLRFGGTETHAVSFAFDYRF